MGGEPFAGGVDGKKVNVRGGLRTMGRRSSLPAKVPDHLLRKKMKFRK